MCLGVSKNDHTNESNVKMDKDVIARSSSKVSNPHPDHSQSASSVCNQVNQELHASPVIRLKIHPSLSHLYFSASSLDDCTSRYSSDVF